MSGITWVNSAGLTGALVLTALAAMDVSGYRAPDLRQGSAHASEPSARVALPGGGFGLPDATGYLVPIRPYHRIISGSIMTDRLLVELCEPDRVLAFSSAGARTSLWRYQYAGKATVEGLGPIEPIIAMKPDLALMNTFGAGGRVSKLRAAGIEVFDMGELRGLSSLAHTARTLAELLGEPERGIRFIQGIERRMKRVAATLGSRPRSSAMYVAVIGPRLYGGTRGTSYGDVITAAGLRDVAAARFRGWTHHSAEDLLLLAPEFVVTKQGMAGPLCAFPGLEGLPACRTPGRIIELPAALLDEPGPSMLDAAEALFESVYGKTGR